MREPQMNLLVSITAFAKDSDDGIWVAKDEADF